MSIVPISSPAALATLRMRSTGPTRIGSISRNRAASTAPCRDTSSHGCAMATLIAGSAWAALISRWYFSCGASCPADSGMFCLGLAALRGPWREHRLDLLQTALAFVRHLAAGRENLVQHLKRRLARSGIAAKQFRQAVDRAFLIQTDQQVLLPHHLLEVGQAHLLIGGMRGTNQLQNRESALIDTALGHTDVNQGPHGSLRCTAHFELLFQFGAQSRDVGLADQIAFDPIRSHLRAAKPDQRLQPWRPISIQKHRFGHRIPKLTKSLQAGCDPR